MQFDKMTDEQIRAQMGPLALEVGRRLSGHWELAHDQHIVGAIIVNGDMRIRFYASSRDNRIWISGKYPRIGEITVRPVNRSPTITFDPDRKPEAIAGEITRRLLPAYSAGLAGHLADLAKIDAAISGNHATAKRIIEALGSAVASVDTDNGGSVSVRSDINYNGRGSMRAWDSGQLVEVSFHSMPADLAVEIAVLIGRHRKETGS